ncbi:MAG TPA: hypothetical protein VGN32_16905, partial [Ktedonobacterales bacterium]|nr:hypothetical protein [Ktedonobacterales bacterium]
MSPLIAWENFYVIVGSSAGALTGLTFVAVTLIREDRARVASRGIAAFTTPTVVHFGAVLFVAAVLSAPWPALWLAALILGLCGLAGVAYTGIVIRRLRRVESYQPVLEDWLWYALLPLLAYIVLIVAALLLPGNAVLALFGTAAMMVLLLFLGIHNAWDTVTYLAVDQLAPHGEQD